MPRELRIAASVFFAALTVALCVLWVRSYWCTDVVLLTHQPKFYTLSWVHGFIGVGIEERTGDAFATHFNFVSFPISASQDNFSKERILGVVYKPSGRVRMASGPIWYGVAVTAAISIGCSRRLPTRFSLRTLLLATTFVAVVLGLAVWLSS
jgi:hypothetical protein